VQPERELLEVVLALGTASGLSRLLNRWQQQGDQDRDDRDHHEQLNEGKGPSASKS
jgi:hypothetical protein